MGKSKLIVDTIAALWTAKEIDAVILISDKGSYTNWSKEELRKHLSVPYVANVYSSTMTDRKADRLMEFIKNVEIPELPIFCFNIEGIITKRADALLQAIPARYERVFICVDESTSIKSLQAQRTKAAIKIGKKCRYRRILTGTPATNSPLDLYSQLAFLSTKILGYDTYWPFRCRYAETQQIQMGMRQFSKITGYKNLDELSAKMAPHCSRILKKDCLDLPDKIYETYDIEWTVEQRSAYDQLRKRGIVQLQTGQIITADAALALLNRLHQITSGWLYSEDHQVIALPSNRIKVVGRVLEEITGKVIIWCHYQGDVETVMAFLKSTYGTDSAVHYYGKTSDADREAAKSRFNDPADPVRFFVGSQSTGGKGLTLVIAHTVIYYSNSYNLEHRLQSEDRCHRYGQTNKVTYVDLILPGSIDEKILLALKAKEDLATEVLSKLRVLLTDATPDQSEPSE